jgi:hypothetical protein
MDHPCFAQIRIQAEGYAELYSIYQDFVFDTVNCFKLQSFKFLESMSEYWQHSARSIITLFFKTYSGKQSS